MQLLEWDGYKALIKADTGGCHTLLTEPAGVKEAPNLTCTPFNRAFHV